MKVFLAALLLITLQHSFAAVSPTSCNETELVAEKVLDLINKWRKDGYLFQLVRVADAHVDQAESAAVYYLVLDVKEFDCPVLSRKHWTDCELVNAKRPSDIVIGQCKVVATSYVKEAEALMVNDFNCTTSSVSSALANTKDSPVLLDVLEDTESYRKYANKALENYKTEHGDFASFRVDKIERIVRARGGERTNYYVDFSVRNCSSHWFPKHSNVFGFCRSDLSYDVENSDLETPTQLAVHCEVFKPEEHRNFSGGKHVGHPFPSDEHKHPPAGRPLFNHCGPREYLHHHKSHKFRCPLPPEDKDHPDGGPPPGPKCRHSIFGHNQTHGPSHDNNHNSSEHHHHGHHHHGHHPHGHHPHGHHPHGHHPHGHHPHGHHPHGHHPHGHHPHGHHPHGHHPHGHHPHGHHPHGHHPHGHHPHGHHPHGHHPHGHHPHGHHPHGHHPHGHHPHGHHPHGHHPHGPDFHDLGPCDPPLHSPGPQYHHHPDMLHKHSKEKGPGKRHSHSHWKQTGYVYRLPPLNKGEILPLPEANFLRYSCSLLNQNKPLKPEIQRFPQSVSELCPGVFKNEFLHLPEFFENTPK